MKYSGNQKFCKIKFFPFCRANVRVGEYNLLTDKDCDTHNPNVCLPPVQDLTVEKVIVHPEYNNLVNDIALLRVTKINLEAGMVLD